MQLLPSLIGHYIRSLRLAKGLTTSQLAEKVGVSQGYISQLENGKSSTYLQHLETICSVLGSTPQELSSLIELPAHIQQLVILAMQLKPDQLDALTNLLQKLVKNQNET